MDDPDEATAGSCGESVGIEAGCTETGFTQLGDSPESWDTVDVEMETARGCTVSSQWQSTFIADEQGSSKGTSPALMSGS